MELLRYLTLQVVEELRRSDLLELLLARPAGIALQGDEESRRQESKPQPARFGEVWMGKVQVLLSSVFYVLSENHGTLRKRVLLKVNSSENKPKTASKGHWNKGR